MGRLYEMAIHISGFRKERIKNIQTQIQKEWNVKELQSGKSTVSFFGEINLSGGESEDEFARKVATLIWNINGAYCKVEVNATYLENLPSETYSFTTKDYRQQKLI